MCSSSSECVSVYIYIYIVVSVCVYIYIIWRKRLQTYIFYANNVLSNKGAFTPINVDIPEISSNCLTCVVQLMFDSK